MIDVIIYFLAGLGVYASLDENEDFTLFQKIIISMIWPMLLGALLAVKADDDQNP